MKKRVVSVVGIRPDLIRMSEVFKKLDAKFNHIIIHSGQHYDRLLSSVFFEELNIREPDYNLGIGGPGIEHYHQTAILGVKIIELLKIENIKPDVVLFLGDSNSVCCALPLAKEGYRIGHIEAGMRSYDRRMLEEMNRVVCDHMSSFLFVYHDDYKRQAMAEGISEEKIFVVGNTIVEPCNKIINELDLFGYPKAESCIILDIHRPENFKDKNRMQNIIRLARDCQEISYAPVKMLAFGRTMQAVAEYGISLDDIEVVPLMSYKQFLKAQYHAAYMISDSGTAQEESALLGTPVVVPRDYTERIQSVQSGCSCLIDVNQKIGRRAVSDLVWWLGKTKLDTSWLGDGTTSDQIVSILEESL